MHLFIHTFIIIASLSETKTSESRKSVLCFNFMMSRVVQETEVSCVGKSKTIHGDKD
jgi:hypothetical protein